MFKKILLALLAVLIAIQFIRPEKNFSDDQSLDISTKYDVPADVKHILSVACNDCHSNKTVYPWYYNIQPVAWWMNEHIEDGKRHLNFSTFAGLSIARQNHKLEETVEMVEDDAMPLGSYTALGMHPEARLSTAQRQRLIEWAKAQMDTLKARYPADSLIMPKRNPAGGNS
ncbi:heme-binding domain-containing protein [Dyadobacter sp. 676]|uniref:Heme-binding domain-containing protein n=1 Tax=Dyadobacter sp. 676 TaxID=3088362 RepID=A0AAU8FGD3_9BACT